MNERVTISQALHRGFITVNLPVFPIMFGPSAAIWVLSKVLGISSAQAYAAFWPFAVAGLPLAWLYWSVMVPRWKLWAYARVEDVVELKRQAVADQLIWPDGHIFEKTEICSQEMRQEILRLQRRSGHHA